MKTGPTTLASVMERGVGNSSNFENAYPNCSISETYKFTTYTVVFCLAFVFGLVGNAGALYIFCKFSVKNRLSTIILIHLAASDLVFILSLPMRIAFYFSRKNSGTDTLTTSALDFACRISTYLFYISMYCSILFLTALSVCRYLVLAGQVRLQNSEACRWVRFLCWGIWCFVVGGNILYLGATSGFSIESKGCLEPEEKSWGLLYNLNMVVLVIWFVLPLTVVLVCYSLMIRHILHTRAGQRRRDVALICLVLSVFCLCFLPYHIQRTLHLHYIMHHKKDCQMQATLKKTVVVTLCFATLNSCLDPLIFLFVGHGFIPVLKKLIAQCATRGWSCSQLVNSSSESVSPPGLQLPLIKDRQTSEIAQSSHVALQFFPKSDTV